MTERTKTIILDLLRERARHLEAALSTSKMLYDREPSPEMEKYLEDLLIALDVVHKVQGM